MSGSRGTGQPGPRRRWSGRDERANGLIMLITMLPVVLSAFGLGLDMSRNVWIRSSLQGALDNATVAAAAVTRVNGNGSLIIDTNPGRTDNAIMTVRLFYAKNRPGFVLCKPGAPALVGTLQNLCWTEEPGYPQLSADGKTITYRIRERSPNSGFLNIVGIRFQDYELRSSARIRE